MSRLSGLTTILVVLFGPCFEVSAVSNSELRFGGFDVNRGGAVFNNPEFLDHIQSQFPNSHIAETADLTEGFLQTVDVLIIGVAQTGTIPISPLTSEEQTALSTFVTDGGAALIFTDNNIQFEAASDSMLAPFGMDSTGVISGAQTASISDLQHSVANGPFGSVSSYDSFWPGWFSSLGPNAVEVGTLDSNGQSSLAAIEPGQLGTGSGGVVFWSDSPVLTDNLFILIDNAIHFTTSGVVAGDVNLDGTVNLLDVAPFVDRIGTGTYQAEADVNCDGIVNLLDVEPFVQLLSGP